MKLYLMRHGPAEDQAASGLDSDRALTASGRARVRAVAKVLAEADELPSHVITSPLVRAVQTAEIVAIVGKLDAQNETVEVSPHLSPGGDAVEKVRALAASGRKRVMLIGHEPDLSALASSLLDGFGRGFDKAMVLGIQIPTDPTHGAGRGELRFVLDPKALKIQSVPS